MGALRVAGNPDETELAALLAALLARKDRTASGDRIGQWRARRREAVRRAAQQTR